MQSFDGNLVLECVRECNISWEHIHACITELHKTYCDEIRNASISIKWMPVHVTPIKDSDQENSCTLNETQRKSYAFINLKAVHSRSVFYIEI